MGTASTRLEMEGTVDTCPACGYKDGFHVSFDMTGDTPEIVLICPQCSSRFRIGWAAAVGISEGEDAAHGE